MMRGGRFITMEEQGRERIMEAVLSLSGEIGYRQVTVRKVLAYSGGHVGQFYSHFRNLDGCFAAAYEAEAERLCTALVGAAAAASVWGEAVRAVLAELLRFAAERPLVTRALLCEVYAAGAGPLAKHDEVIERVTAAIGFGCSRQEGPETAIAPVFVVGAVEGVICSRLARGEAEKLPATLPDLMHLIVGSFLGKDAARDELRRPPS
jgi:AcrR family transcriptional regulator